MPNIQIRNPVKMGKRKERSQMFEVITPDGRWKDLEMPVLNNTADDGTRAFRLDGANQYYCEEDNSWHQIICDIDYEPLRYRTNPDDPSGKRNDDKNKIENDLFGLTFEQEKAKQYEKAKKNQAAQTMIWLFSIVFGSFTIIAAIVYLRG